MPQPNVRADTLDQASAQDHSKASNNARNGQGHTANQAEATKNVAQEQAHEQHGFNPLHRNGREEDDIDRDLADSATLTGDEGLDDDDMMDRMSSSPSIEDEDIDFEMVYALHTFTATVEGQANATKGEHMVLLDDSNSYWWLVRIVRDSSIGYLPAEHIETPTERLARLNKHRNIDLAANMLSDSAHEKSKNPLKKAMRRRHAKTVTFTAPTYVEASDYDYSTEEGEGDDYFNEDDEEGREGFEDGDETELNGGKLDSASQDERNRATVQVIQPASENGGEDVKLRKNPTPASLRHPDSAVFNDDKVETKKLTLTPGLLRDDGNPASSTNGSVKPLGKGILEKDKQPSRAEAVTSPPPHGKERRHRKPGSVLGNLFKKRAKKGRKEEEEELEEWLHGGEKRSVESARESEDSVSSQTRNREREEAQKREAQQRLQQRERERERGVQEPPSQLPEQASPPQQQQQQQASTIRKVEPEKEIVDEKPVQIKVSQPTDSQEQQRAVIKPLTVQVPEPKVNDVQPARDEEKKPKEEKPVVNGSPSTSTEQKPEFKPQHNRYMSADKSSPIETVYQPFNTHTPQQKQAQLQPQPQAVVQRPQTELAPTKQATQPPAQQQQPGIDRLSESPEQITFHDASDRPDLSVDTSSGDDTNAPTPSPTDSSPELIEHTAIIDSEPQPVVKPWSDYNLRTYFEDDNDVRDMLIVVQHDKAPGGIKKDHPDILPLFHDATHRLSEITKKLDGMLGDWLSRRTRSRSSNPQS
ncbi:protein phosphatase regulator [Rhizina undulata]